MATCALGLPTNITLSTIRKLSTMVGGTTIQNSDNPKVKKVYSHNSSKLLDKQQIYVPAKYYGKNLIRNETQRLGAVIPAHI